MAELALPAKPSIAPAAGLACKEVDQEQAAHGDGLHRKGNQGFQTTARTVSPRTIEQRISEHGVLLSFGAASKDTSRLSRRRQAIQFCKNKRPACGAALGNFCGVKGVLSHFEERVVVASLVQGAPG